MSPPSGPRTLRVPRGRGALAVSTVCVRTGRVIVRWRSARCLHHLGPEHCGCREVAERSMSPPSGPRTLRVPCGRGALDVATTGVPNFVGAVRSRSARRRRHAGTNSAGAVRSRSARCRHHGWNELGGFAVRSRSAPTSPPCGSKQCERRKVAERSRSSPPGARTLLMPCGRGAPDVSTGLCPNLAGAVWSRSARCLHQLEPELCECRVVAGRPMSSPSGARTWQVP